MKKSTIFCIGEGIVIVGFCIWFISAYKVTGELLSKYHILSEEKETIREENEFLREEIITIKTDFTKEINKITTENDKLKVTLSEIEAEKNQYNHKKEIEIEKLRKVITLYEDRIKALESQEENEVIEEEAVVTIEEEKKLEVKKETKKVKIPSDKELAARHITSKADFMQGITWYHSTRDCSYDIDYKTDGEVRLYCGKYKTGLKCLRLKVLYDSNDWMFIEKIQFKSIEGNNVIIDLSREKENEVYNDGILEWADVKVTDQQIVNLTKILKSNKIFIKLHGKYPEEFEMTKEQLLAFREIMSLYNYMNFE